MANSLYFAYGSNLNLADWHRWCDTHGYPRNLLNPIGTAVLPDHELSFSHYSMSRNGGALNILEAKGKGVEGVVFEVTAPEGWDALDQKEGAPLCYKRQAVQLLNYEGEQFPAKTYLLPTERVREYQQPTAEYVDAVEKGLEHFDLDTHFLHAAADNREVPYLTSGFFCYGTLMRFESRFRCLKEHDISCAILASVPGRLVNLGDYPGMLQAIENDQEVRGEFFRVKDIHGALNELDRIEGFNGYESNDSLYSRRLVRAYIGSGLCRLAWVYVFQGTEGEMIESGCWRTEQGNRENHLRQIIQGHCQRNPQILGQMSKRYPVRCGGDWKNLRGISEFIDALYGDEITERRMARISQCFTVCC